MLVKSIGQIILLASILFTLTACESDESDENKATYEISGYTQKGPFVNGSSVDIQELDASLNPTGITYATQTTNDFGAFEIGTSLSSPYVEIRNTGFYFDEVIGDLSATNLTLRTITDLSTGIGVNVNILTHLEKQRLETLVDSGFSFGAARAQAQAEVLALFGIDATGLMAFDKMDIVQPGDSNAVLLAVSAIITRVAVERASDQSRVTAELSAVLSAIITDIEADGILDAAESINSIAEASRNIHLAGVRTHLEEYLDSLGLTPDLPLFENYVDSDKDGLLNGNDDDDDGDGILDSEDSSPQGRGVTWESKTAMPTPYSGFESVALNNKIYIFLNDTLIEYDPASGAFADKSSPPTIRRGFTTAVVNEKIYIIGGAGDSAAVEEYDPNSDSWLIKSEIPNPRSDLGSASLNGKIYAFGGEDAVNSAGDADLFVHMYDPNADSWSQKPDMPSPRVGYSVSVVNGKIYIIGGQYSGPFTMDEFDPITDTWSSAAAPLTARLLHAAPVVNGKIYVIGGCECIAGGEYYSVVEEYDPLTVSVATKTAMPFARYWFASSVLDNKIYILGGIGEELGLLANIDVYAPEEDVYDDPSWFSF